MTFIWWFHYLTILFPAKNPKKQDDDNQLLNKTFMSYKEYKAKNSNKRICTYTDPIWIIDTGEGT
jgi:hypothetical protein